MALEVAELAVQKTKLWKSALTLAIVLSVLIAIGGLVSVVRSSFAEARENVTFRELARNNERELQEAQARNERSLERVADLNTRLAKRREVVEKIVREPFYINIAEDCEIPDGLWDLLDD